jgi:hypothetical protein
MTKQQFNDNILQLVHSIINDEELEHLTFDHIVHCILTELDYDRSNMIENIKDRAEFLDYKNNPFRVEMEGNQEQVKK